MATAFYDSTAAEPAVGGASQAFWFRCASKFFFFFLSGSIGGLAPSADHMAIVTVIATCILIDIIFVPFFFFYFSFSIFL
jgi:hypothetical protein